MLLVNTQSVKVLLLIKQLFPNLSEQEHLKNSILFHSVEILSVPFLKNLLQVQLHKPYFVRDLPNKQKLVFKINWSSFFFYIFSSVVCYFGIKMENLLILDFIWAM